jgi:hypothetical protein
VCVEDHVNIVLGFCDVTIFYIIGLPECVLDTYVLPCKVIASSFISKLQIMMLFYCIDPFVTGAVEMTQRDQFVLI